MLRKLLVSVSILFTLSLSQFVCADNAFISRPEVRNFIQLMVKKHGFSHDELVKLFSAIKIRPRIMKNMNAQLEQQPWYSYQNVFINESHIREGVKFWNRNKEALSRAEQVYGVPASIIVATIGVETKYGKNKGEYPVIDALANIGFSDSPRAGYFRQELEEFLLLTREQHLNPYTVKGSYAGAIGQPQFMPSSYRYYAVNFSGNSHIDLTNNEYDIIGSIANYYQKHGWKPHQPVVIPTAQQKNLYQILLPHAVHARYGVQENGIYPYLKIPSKEKVRVIELRGMRGNEFWIGFHNFDVIKRYNASNLYAMAVYQLSYYIKALKERSNHV